MILTSIFYHVDEFCKDLNIFLKNKTPGERTSKTGKKPRMTLSEIMTITIYFHHSKMRTFKDYYSTIIKRLLFKAFPKAVSYNRFIELMQQSAMFLYLFLTYCCMGKVTGISFVDSMALVVCNNLRISSNKVFKACAARGKTSTGWFYGFKLHIVINEYGEIISFDITPGNIDDRNKKVMEKLTKPLWGKLFGDRGYLSEKLRKSLYSRGISLFTRIRKGMKNVLMTLEDKILLQKRGLIESVNGILQSSCLIEHTRHRSVINFLVNVLSGLAAYTFLDKKPSIVKPLKPRISECF